MRCELLFNFYENLLFKCGFKHSHLNLRLAASLAAEDDGSFFLDASSSGALPAKDEEMILVSF